MMLLYFIHTSAQDADQPYAPSPKYPGVTSLAMEEELFEKPEDVGSIFDSSWEKLISLCIQDKAKLDVQCTLANMKLYVEIGGQKSSNTLSECWEDFKNSPEIHKPFFQFLRLYCDGSFGQKNLPILEKLKGLIISSDFIPDLIKNDLLRYLEVSTLQTICSSLQTQIGIARANESDTSTLESKAKKIEAELQALSLKKNDLSNVVLLLKEGTPLNSGAPASPGLPWERADLEYLPGTLIGVIDGLLGTIQTFKSSWGSTIAYWTPSGILSTAIKSQVQSLFGEDYPWLIEQLKLQGKTIDDVCNVAAQLLTRENVEACESFLHAIQKMFQRIDFDKLSEKVNTMSFQPGNTEAWIAPDQFEEMLPWFKKVSYPQIASIFHTLGSLCVNFRTMQWGLPDRNSPRLVNFALNPNASLEILGAFHKFSSIVLTILFNVPFLPEESRQSLKALIDSVLLNPDAKAESWWEKYSQPFQPASTAALAAASTSADEATSTTTAASSPQQDTSSQTWGGWAIKGAKAWASPQTQNPTPTMSFLNALQILARFENQNLINQFHDLLMPAFLRYMFPDCSWCILNDIVNNEMTPDAFYQKMNLSVVSENSLRALAQSHRALRSKDPASYNVPEVLGKFLLKLEEAIQNAPKGSDLKAQLTRSKDALLRALR